ncbi:spore coat U domain-containing protein [Gluconacetobacter sacchari]|uniref:Spore coat protein U domain-containing protein n=2 Tax=Gluconacetobacter sacchari TaxID=92759 RepID=A0A7W4IDY3_9PROT|nr:spore coat U domain-containing protein [Gluconacetobacter sacchari]MBB2161064.1 spore coat protein U domain-containing protein [Gluconacetobacter sacchari]GBQ26390.1 spore coat U domain-containing protein [Gluconacetobacter sacchari DSM 12717]
MPPIGPRTRDTAGSTRFAFRRPRPGHTGLLVAAAAFALGHPDVAAAQTSITGTIGVTLTLTSACSINGTILASGSSANFGTLDFGTATTLFTQQDAQVLTGSSGGISLTCSPGISPQLTVTSGGNDTKTTGGHLHALVSGSSNVSYDLYSDSSRTTVVQNNAALALTASSTTYTTNLYGRVFGAGTASVLPAGVYTDTLNVTLSF